MREKMTREEAIMLLKEYAQYSYGIWHNDEEDTKAFDMAIEALMQDCNQLTTNLQPTCNKIATDLIRREDAIDAWWHDEVFFGGQRDDMTKEQWLDYITDVISSFPSAEPKTGHWLEIEDYNGDIHYQCDQCGEEFILIDGTPEDNNYWHCPNCGSCNREVRKNDTRCYTLP